MKFVLIFFGGGDDLVAESNAIPRIYRLFMEPVPP
jgi:hypothetical protein